MQKWDTTGFEIPTDTHADICDAVKRIRDGVETIRFNYRGTTDPSLSLSWGAAQVGTRWQDIGSAGSGASVTNPLYKIWDDLTGGASYGWRIMCLRYMKYLTSPRSILGLFTGRPWVANVVKTAITLTTDLDAAGVQDNDAKNVTEVLLRIRAEDTGTIGGDTEGYIEFRPFGLAAGTNRLYLPAGGRPHEFHFWTRFGADPDFEKLEYLVQVAGTSPSFDLLSADILAFAETL